MAALTPRPRINLVLYHGVLVPHAGWRARVVAYSALPVEAPVAAGAAADANAAPAVAQHARHWAWAELMRRALDIDVLACPRCGGRMRSTATVEDPDAIRAILAALASRNPLTARLSALYLGRSGRSGALRSSPRESDGTAGKACSVNRAFVPSML
jgi:hypothetical protein